MKCPNFSNPEVRDQFDNMIEAIGPKQAYGFYSLNNGNTLNNNTDGTPSILYNNLLEDNMSEIEAIREVARTHTQGFLDEYGDWKGLKREWDSMKEKDNDDLIILKGKYNIKINLNEDFTPNTNNKIDKKKPKDITEINENLNEFINNNELDKVDQKRKKEDNYTFLFDEANKEGVSMETEMKDPSSITDDKARDTSNVLAYFNPDTNKIGLTTNFNFLSDNSKTRILAHEALHGVITNKLSKLDEEKTNKFNSDVKEFIESVRANENLSKQEVVNRVLNSIENGNIQELITYAFTDKEFAAALNGEVLSREGEEKKTFWTKLKELIVSVLSDDYTKLDELVDIMDYHLDIKPEVNTQENIEIKTNENEEVLAPNGEISKLYKDIEKLEDVKSKKQSLQLYKQTRSKEFKEWFGDSKVVDENDEPLLMYHSTVMPFKTYDFKKVTMASKDGGKGIYLSRTPLIWAKYQEQNQLPNNLIKESNAISLFKYGKTAFEIAEEFNVSFYDAGSLTTRIEGADKYITEEYKKAIKGKTYKDAPKIRRDIIKNISKPLKKAIIMPLFVRSENLKEVDDLYLDYEKNGEELSLYDAKVEGKVEQSFQMVVRSPNQIKSVFNRGTFSKENDNIMKAEKLDYSASKSPNTPSDNYSLMFSEKQAEQAIEQAEQEEADSDISEELMDDTTLKILSDLDSKINSFRSKQRDDSDSYQKYKDRIEKLIEYKNKIEQESKAGTFIEAVKESMKWIDADMLQDQISDVDLMHSIDTVESYIKTIEELLNLTDSNGERYIANSDLVKELTNINGRLNKYSRRLNNKKNEFILEESKRMMNRELTKEEIMRVPKENKAENVGLDISNFKSRLVQMLNAVQTLADKNRMTEFQLNVSSKLEEILDKLPGDKLTTEQKNKLIQLDSNGKPTQNLVDRFSLEWGDYINESKRKMARIKSRMLGADNRTKIRLQKEWNEEMRKRALQTEYLNIKALREEGTEAYKEEYKKLVEKVGKNKANNLVYEVNKKYDKYLKAIEEYSNVLVSEGVSDEDVNRLVKAKAKELDPEENYKKMQEISEGKSKGTMNSDAFRFLVNIPKREIEGKKTKWYDSRYDDIQSSELSELYNFMVETNEQVLKYLPYYVKSGLGSNFLAYKKKTIKDKVFESRLGIKDILKATENLYLDRSNEEGKDAVYDKNNQVIGSPPIKHSDQLISRVRQAMNNLENNYIIAKEFLEKYDQMKEKGQQKFLKKANRSRNLMANYHTRMKQLDESYNTLTRELSGDIIGRFQDFTRAAIDYKHKSKYVNLARLIQHAYGHASVLATNKRGATATDRRNQPITIDANKSEVEKVIAYNIESIFYGESKTEQVSKSFKFGRDPKDKKALKEFNKEKQSLKEDFAKGIIDKETYDERLDVMESNLFNNFQIDNLSYAKILDNIIKYTYYKNIGWNPMAGVANFMFGEMSNAIEASSAQFFTTKDKRKAQSKMMHAVRKALTTHATPEANKIKNLLLNLGVTYDMLDINYGDNRALDSKIKKLGLLQPMELFKRGEFYHQGIVMVSMMLNRKIKNKKGEEKSLYDAFDENGDFKNEEFDNSNGDWDMVPTYNNEFNKLRNKIIGVNKRVHGNYDTTSIIYMKKGVLGRALMTFKTWLPEAINTRFGSEKYIDTLDSTVKGRYRSYLEVGNPLKNLQVMKDILMKEVIKKEKLKEGYMGLSEVDIQNMRRNFKEVQYGLSLLAVFFLAKAALPEDDEEEKHSFTQNLVMDLTLRVQSDITQYVNPIGLSNLTNNPLPALNTVTQGMSSLYSIFKEMGDDEYDYERVFDNVSKNIPLVRQASTIQEFY